MARNRSINYRELKRQVELNGPEATVAHLTEALETKELRPEDFSIRELAEAFNGREWVQSFNPRHGESISLLETGAVKNSSFSNITGQIVYNKVLNAFEDEQFIFSNEVETVPTDFNGERIAGIGGIGDENERVDEGQPFPLVSPNEDYIDTAPTIKRGARIALTKEAIFFDRTGQLMEQARKLGYFLGLNKEKRVIDAIIDENAGAASIRAGGHRYHWRGTSYASYFSSSNQWLNLSASTALVDWTDVEALELLLAAITDPNTGEPVMVLPEVLIVTPELLHTARRIISATEIRHGPQGSTSASAVTANSPNVLDNYRILSSRLLAARQGTDSSWFLGNIRRAVAYMENWPVTTLQSPANSQEEFERDIVMSWRTSERGAAQVIEPRALSKATVA
jgi:hypothetical protein